MWNRQVAYYLPTWMNYWVARYKRICRCQLLSLDNTFFISTYALFHREQAFFYILPTDLPALLGLTLLQTLYIRVFPIKQRLSRFSFSII